MIYVVILIVGIILAVVAWFLGNSDPKFPISVGLGVLASLLITLFCRMGLDEVPEMLHYNYLTMTYYEHWNEYIQKTCTRESCTGSGENRSCTTETYDCSYVDDHPEHWDALTNASTIVSVTEGDFLNAVSLWGNKKFIDMHRDFHTIDGDAYTTSMPIADLVPTSPKVLGYSKQGKYKNKIVFNPSVFNFAEVTPEEKSQYKLYEWNENSFMGGSGVAKMYLDNANYLYGFRDQISLRMMIFNNQPAMAGKLQECLWKGGNKNEFNVAIGVSENKIDWVYVISWTTNQRLKIDVRDSILAMGVYNAPQIAKYLVTDVPKRFIRREFKEFDYLPESPTPIYTFILVALVLLGSFAAPFMIEKMKY